MAIPSPDSYREGGDYLNLFSDLQYYRHLFLSVPIYFS